jgi:AcrR family transcriptional regulator
VIKPKRGRRSGQSTTKAQILQAARACFTSAGFDGTTLREIAARAGVDTALVHHYFDTKRALFEAALALPDRANPKLIAALKSPRPGDALIVSFLEDWDGPNRTSSFAQLLRTAATEPETQQRLTELIAGTIIAPALSAVAARADLPRLRATLVAAQLVGIAWLRYVVCVEPVASASPKLLAKTYGPSITATLQGAAGPPRV